MKKISAALLILGALAVFWHFVSPNIPDLDSFFYLGKALLMREQGLAEATFPWAQLSVIKETSSSLWFGFSLLMLPFSFLPSPSLAIKIFGILVTLFALGSCYFVARRHQFHWPIFWPLLMFFSAPNVTAQLLMVRPQTLTVGLGLLLLSFLIRGGWMPVFIVSFFISWIHLNFSWIAIAILGIVIVGRIIIDRKVEWLKIIAVPAALLLGWVARPNPIGAAKLFYIQVVQQILEKQSGLPLLFGTENLPLGSATLFRNFSPFLAIWIFAGLMLAWWIIKKQLVDKQKILIASSSVFLSLVFFSLSILIARRSYNFWIAFGVLAIALAFSWILDLARQRYDLKPLKDWAAGIAVFSLIFLTFFSGLKTLNSLAKSYPPDLMKESAEWLAKNSQPGDLVFNLHWSHFSPLFLWNRSNYYIGGLDPIFQYRYNPELYWLFHYPSAGISTSVTCRYLECTNDSVESTYSALKNDFRAKYILVSKPHNPNFNKFAASDPRFEKVFEAVNEVVYLIK
ncbi:MAG: hypothetical protein Q7S83_01250 [bacterium]|nr:hypothetical protein [bacterium]